MAFADETSPVFLPGAFEVAIGFVRAGERIRERFTSGEGYGWHEHDQIVHRGTERFFRSGYQAHVVSEWIPALHGVDERLRAGGLVAGVGRGYGASAILIAQAYPDTHVVGFDYHEATIAEARRRADAAGVGERVPRSRRPPPTPSPAATTTSWPASTACTTWATPSPPPATCTRRSHRRARGGSSSRARATHRENLNPVGRPTTPARPSPAPRTPFPERGTALGAQAGEARLREVVLTGGFHGSAAPPRRRSTSCSRPGPDSVRLTHSSAGAACSSACPLRGWLGLRSSDSSCWSRR